MTKREAAERNVKDSNDIGCEDCPLKKECPKPRSYASCTVYSKQYLADNPVDDWQELELKESEYEYTIEIKHDRGVLRYRPRQPEKKEQPTLMNRISKMLREEGMLMWANPDGSFQILSPDDERAVPAEPEKKEVSHEEIMRGKYWKVNSDVWGKVIGFDVKIGSYHIGGVKWVNKTWFTNRESATIPPEAK